MSRNLSVKWLLLTLIFFYIFLVFSIIFLGSNYFLCMLLFTVVQYISGNFLFTQLQISLAKCENTFIYPHLEHSLCPLFRDWLSWVKPPRQRCLLLTLVYLNFSVKTMWHLIDFILCIVLSFSWQIVFSSYYLVFQFTGVDLFLGQLQLDNPFHIRSKISISACLTSKEKLWSLLHFHLVYDQETQDHSCLY